MLWRALRGSRVDGMKFRRQVPIGPYIADFLCFQHRLIAELDGPPHDDAERKNRDLVRDEWLRAQGYRVLRFSNDLVNGGGDIVVDKIRAAIANAPGS
jgi:BirA family biotin operon repressor/biotin-[acetyl-CoA-carboxylase] ligase